MIAIRKIASKTTKLQPATLYSSLRKMAISPKVKIDEGELPKKWVEVEIKMPWGKVAGKLWNPNKTQPILALHGWQDNAGSWDNLIPLLPEKTSVLAIDLPGHGFSSWIPKGMLYDDFFMIQTIHRVKQHFGWKKIALMGHSMSSRNSFLYNVLFPHNVKFVVTMDYLWRPENIDVNNLTNSVAQSLEYCLNLEKWSNPSATFTEEQTIKKLIEVSKNYLDESACRTLMIRGFTKKSDGTLCVNRDPRLKANISLTFSDDRLEKQAERIASPYLIFKGTEWPYNVKENNFFHSIEAMRKNSADVRYYDVPGNHHFHMMNSRFVAELIVPFIEKYN